MIPTKTWRERVIETQDLSPLFPLANEWATCAVGEAATQHPCVVMMIRESERAWNDGPEDETLNRLGFSFQWAIGNNDRARALAILDQIDDRVLALKRKAT